LPRAKLPQLYVDGFDAEQIWAELELQRGAVLSHVDTQFAVLRKLQLQKQQGGTASAAESVHATTTTTLSSNAKMPVVASEKRGPAGAASKSNAAVATSALPVGGSSAGGHDDSGSSDTDADAHADADSDVSDRDDMEGFLDETERAVMNEAGADDSDADDAGRGDQNDDDDDSIDYNAPIPESDSERPAAERRKKKRGVAATSETIGRLSDLLSIGPRFEDLYGPKDEFAAREKAGKATRQVGYDGQIRGQSAFNSDGDGASAGSSDGREVADAAGEAELDFESGDSDDEFIDAGLGDPTLQNYVDRAHDDDDGVDDEDGDENEDEDDGEPCLMLQRRNLYLCQDPRHCYAEADGDEMGGDVDVADDDGEPSVAAATARARRRAALMEQEGSEPEDDDDDDDDDEEEDEEVRLVRIARESRCPPSVPAGRT
jgi:hypothetical protein